MHFITIFKILGLVVSLAGVFSRSVLAEDDSLFQLFQKNYPFNYKLHSSCEITIADLVEEFEFKLSDGWQTNYQRGAENLVKRMKLSKAKHIDFIFSELDQALSEGGHPQKLSFREVVSVYVAQESRSLINTFIGLIVVQNLAQLKLLNKDLHDDVMIKLKAGFDQNATVFSCENLESSKSGYYSSEENVLKLQRKRAVKHFVSLARFYVAWMYYEYRKVKCIEECSIKGPLCSGVDTLSASNEIAVRKLLTTNESMTVLHEFLHKMDVEIFPNPIHSNHYLTNEDFKKADGDPMWLGKLYLSRFDGVYACSEALSAMSRKENKNVITKLSHGFFIYVSSPKNPESVVKSTFLFFMNEYKAKIVALQQPAAIPSSDWESKVLQFEELVLKWQTKNSKKASSFLKLEMVSCITCSITVMADESRSRFLRPLDAFLNMSIEEQQSIMKKCDQLL